MKYFFFGGVVVLGVIGVMLRSYFRSREEDIRFRSRPWDGEASDRLDRLRAIAAHKRHDDEDFYARR